MRLRMKGPGLVVNTSPLKGEEETRHQSYCRPKGIRLEKKDCDTESKANGDCLPSGSLRRLCWVSDGRCRRSRSVKSQLSASVNHRRGCCVFRRRCEKHSKVDVWKLAAQSREEHQLRYDSDTRINRPSFAHPGCL
jgi:hypothetical protein